MVEVKKREYFIGYDGKEYSKEELDDILGSTFIGNDGKKYMYTKKVDSSSKMDIEVTITQTKYYKLVYVAVDDNNVPLAGATPQTPVCAKTDFLRKTQNSISMMSYIIYTWIRLKSPLNRISCSLAEYGIALSRQQLYKNVGITACMLMTIFKHMESPYQR